MGLIIGIDLCDDYSQVCVSDPAGKETEALTLSREEASCLIPTMICKKKRADIWFVGEEAYKKALFNEGVVADKLIRMAQQDGSATIEGVRYSAEELLYRFLKQLLDMVYSRFMNDTADSLVFTLRELSGSVMDMLVRIAERLGISRDRVRIMSHSECFLYYVLSRPKDVWTNSVCLFDLTDEGLDYFEMRVIRGRNPQVVEAAKEKLEEGFSLNVLDSASGEHMGDSILSSCADRLLTRKIISSVILTGKGFSSTDWAPGFLKKVCFKRKVFAGQHIFASGAAVAAADSLKEESAFPFVFMCEGRIKASVEMDVRYDGRFEKLVLAEMGTNWYEARTSVELIPDAADALEFFIRRYGHPHAEKVLVGLDEFPERPNKTTRTEVILSFTEEDLMTIRVRDLGFGEFFPSSGIVVRKDISI